MISRYIIEYFTFGGLFIFLILGSIIYLIIIAIIAIVAYVIRKIKKAPSSKASWKEWAVILGLLSFLSLGGFYIKTLFPPQLWDPNFYLEEELLIFISSSGLIPALLSIIFGIITSYREKNLKTLWVIIPAIIMIISFFIILQSGAATPLFRVVAQ